MLEAVPRPLVTARVGSIALISYAVPASVVAPFLPAAPGGGTLEPDTPPESLAPPGMALVSVAAVAFTNIRTLGVPVPGFTDVLEVNLRAYVRCGARRGIVFIRQLVSRPRVAGAARFALNAPCRHAPIRLGMSQDVAGVKVEYGVRPPAQRSPAGAAGEIGPEGVLRLRGSKPVVRPGPRSDEAWVKEVSLAFGVDRRGRPFSYEVLHPAWGIHPVTAFDSTIDHAALFGADWGFLGGLAPVSMILAAGSEMVIFPPAREVPVRWSLKR
jgi:uncharacterized protein YqjF (DUF2071 family)